MTFQTDITKFNTMYGLPAGDVPNLSSFNALQRLDQFEAILGDELQEANEIKLLLDGFPTKETLQLKALIEEKTGTKITNDELALVMLADWLGDIVIYATSEAKRYGINLLGVLGVLDVIMQSNFSKLGADGNPILDANNKVQKGPNYWKPEPALLAVIREARTAQAKKPSVLGDGLGALATANLANSDITTFNTAS